MRKKFCACGPSRPARFDLMAVPLQAARGGVFYALHSKKIARKSDFCLPIKPEYDILQYL